MKFLQYSFTRLSWNQQNSNSEAGCCKHIHDIHSTYIILKTKFLKWRLFIVQSSLRVHRKGIPNWERNSRRWYASILSFSQNLTWRDVQHLIVRSSQPLDSSAVSQRRSTPSWRTNAANLTGILAKMSSSIMDKSVDTFEQNKRFLSASFRNFKKHLFCL